MNFEYDDTIPAMIMKCKVISEKGDVKIYDIPHKLKHGDIISLLIGTKEDLTYEN